MEWQQFFVVHQQLLLDFVLYVFYVVFYWVVICSLFFLQCVIVAVWNALHSFLFCSISFYSHLYICKVGGWKKKKNGISTSVFNDSLYLMTFVLQFYPLLFCWWLFIHESWTGSVTCFSWFLSIFVKLNIYSIKWAKAGCGFIFCEKYDFSRNKFRNLCRSTKLVGNGWSVRSHHNSFYLIIVFIGTFSYHIEYYHYPYCIFIDRNNMSIFLTRFLSIFRREWYGEVKVCYIRIQAHIHLWVFIYLFIFSVFGTTYLSQSQKLQISKIANQSGWRKSFEHSSVTLYFSFFIQPTYIYVYVFICLCWNVWCDYAPSNTVN